MKNPARLVVAACHLGLLLSSSAVVASDLEMLWSPAEPKSACPNMTLGFDGTLYLTWLERSEGCVMKFSYLDHKNWSPAKVVVKGRSVRSDAVDVPGMTVLDDGTAIVAHWGDTSFGSRFTRTVLAYSLDGGTVWSYPLRLDAGEGWMGVLGSAPLSRDRAALVWSEGVTINRDWRQEGGEQITTLRFATVSRDGELSEPALLDSTVCGGCAPGLAPMADGSLVLAYRDLSESGLNGISCLYFDGTSWSERKPVHAEGWLIHNCPVSGPAIDALGRYVAVTWLTENAEGQMVVRVAFSRDGGEFDPPIDVGSIDPVGRPDISLLSDGTAWVVWMEESKDPRVLSTKAMLEVRLRAVAPDGTLEEPIPVAWTGYVQQSKFPQLARYDDEIYVAWTQTQPLRSDGNAPSTPDQVQVARVLSGGLLIRRR